MMRLLALRVDAVHPAVTEAVNSFCHDHGAHWYSIGGSMSYHWQFKDEANITAALLKFADVPLRVVDL